ncbi:hypothetical protein AB0M10_22650 [Streptomyces sp. NPDC051840]|uniref:WXG100 family type VII secretion target n=1 Tax=Streptomyces sp. NPDC051840 TaxID=3154752 RepID=UPI00343EBF36
MSEPKQPDQSTEVPPELTPAEQREQDQERVTGQIVVTDVTRQMQAVMETFGFGGSGSSGRTSFEGHELNAMIDLIENSSPEHLEEAGQALLKARTSLNDAAKDLGDFIGAVDWEGESGSAFRDWGNGLVAHAYKLGEYAQTAGTQITVAGTGLASVRSSLPPRDTRLVRKSPEDIESPARIDDNPEYAAAVKVEKDRQEAINQANRLASYYAVSEETLAAQEPPRFDKKLDVAMPRPSRGRAPVDSGSSASSEDSDGRRSVSESARATTDGPTSLPSSRGFESPVTVTPVLDETTSTEINSVALPQAPGQLATPAPSPAGGPTATTGGPALQVPPVLTSPVTSTSRVPLGPTGVQKGFSAGDNTRAPRAGAPTSSGPVGNRPGIPAGRPPGIGGTPTSHGSGRVGGGPQPPMAGRNSTTGLNSPRAGRPTGIVGGTPQRAAASGTGSARGVPRGTVIGAGGTNNAARPTGRATSSTNGVVGSPRAEGLRSGAGAKGFTTGGAGLVRGPSARKDSGEDDQDQGTPRPDYLTEDRETWESGRRGAAPPVIE